MWIFIGLPNHRHNTAKKEDMDIPGPANKKELNCKINQESEKAGE